MAEADERPGGVHSFGIPAKQRLHLATVLILLGLAAPLSAQDISFDPEITQEQFATFSQLVGQAIYATPVEPARARSLLGFDIGIAVTAVPIDTNADYWQSSVGDDFSVSGYVAVPRLVVSKGLGKANLSASVAKVQDTELSIWGGALDVPIIDGGLLRPSVAVRGVYSTLRGVDVFDCKTYGAELFVSKGVGPLTPYAAIGRMRVDASGEVPAAITFPPRIITDESDMNRFTVGLRLSLFLPKIVIEATQAGDERSYAAKVSIGL